MSEQLETGEKPKYKPVPPRQSGKRGRRVPMRMLRDMRWVYEHPEGEDSTPGREACRKFLAEDPKGFLSKMTALEVSHRAKREAALAKDAKKKDNLPGAPQHTDEGSKRTEELIERLLDQARGEAGANGM